MKQNPAWTQKAVKEFFKKAPGTKLPMPVKILDPEKSVAEVREQIAGRLKKPSWQFAEYGTGHYGTVMPTEQKGIVMKVTSDATEARFVKAALAIEAEKPGYWPHGMVKYHDIYKLGGTSHIKRPVYVLWRDELTPFNSARQHFDDYEKRTLAEGEREMRVYLALARNFFTTMKDVGGRAVLQEMERFYNDLTDKAALMVERLHEKNSTWVKPSELFRGRVDKLQKASILLRALEWQFETLANSYFTQYVGTAFGFYLEHGIVLADVHFSNIGHKQNGKLEAPAIIMDPGHSVFLTDAYNSVGIEEI